MIKRSQSKIQSKKRLARRPKRAQKRRLLMEGLEARQLLAGDITGPFQDINLPEFPVPRNVGTVQAFAFRESEFANQAGFNDFFNTADPVPLGNLPGQYDTIDLQGTLPFIPSADFTRTDVDTFALDLKAGDILDIAVTGAASSINVLYDNGSLWYGTDSNQGTPAPNSPLMTSGNAVIAQVVPEDGRYYLSIAPGALGSSYTAALRTYRPIAEQLPIGAQQILYVDFDGAIYPASVLGSGGGVVRIPSLQESMPLLGLPENDDALVDRIITETMDLVERQFHSVVTNGNNGDWDATGIPGQYGITILNSRDHPDPGANPLVTRVNVGGSTADVRGATTFGVSSTLDIGNFKMDDIVIGVLDNIVAEIDADLDDIVAPATMTDAIIRFLALLISHEAGHSFGLRHTTNGNFFGTIMDEGLNMDQYVGAGPDDILGTADDVDLVEFADDRFSLFEGIFGRARTPDTLANTLVVGTAGGRVTGRVFRDTNADGSGKNEPGLGGLLVFGDTDGDGQRDTLEPFTRTRSDGTYQLAAAPGTYEVTVLAPNKFDATTNNGRTINVQGGETVSGVNFGFAQVIPDVTGIKWSDSDQDGVFDDDERVLSGVYIYADLDGDNRPDLGEPSAVTGDDGRYGLILPNNGTFQIREVVPAGFLQTFPDTGEHVVDFDGAVLTDDFNFGNFSSRDYGDAPASYGAPSHGIVDGLTLGEFVDRDPDANPTPAADGDDLDQEPDDEDGLQQTSPIGLGSPATFDVTVNNSSGSPAYLQAWADVDGDGTFDANEQVVKDLQLNTGTRRITVNVPDDAQVGSTYMRLRYSNTLGLGPTGDASTGEVEDHLIVIREDASLATNDRYTLSRPDSPHQLDVLENDFVTDENGLRIEDDGLPARSAEGGVLTLADDNQSVIYSVPAGFLGEDSFTYSVRDNFGNTGTATVTINVIFNPEAPIAIDDTFAIPQNSTNRILDVLENDISSVVGGLTVVDVTPGSEGGTVEVFGGGQSVSYSPTPNFAGTEQFDYVVEDPAGNQSTATVTVSSVPGAELDDVVEYSFAITDQANDAPIGVVQVGDRFNLTVLVDDLRPNFGSDPRGIATAFLDVLYNDELVKVVEEEPIVIFGDLFEAPGDDFEGFGFTRPGLIDEAGGVQPDLENPVTQAGPVQLFTVTLQALAPGVALFQADPADDEANETTVIDGTTPLTPSRLRLRQARLTVRDPGNAFPSAIDDSFPLTLDDQGIQVVATDSEGDQIVADRSGPNVLDVLDNDNFGPSETINDFNIVISPGNGTATINDNDTPSDLTDDYVDYVADSGFNGFDSFVYSIISGDGVRSTAEVTLNVGTVADDDLLVEIDFDFIDADGNSVEEVAVGDIVGLQVNLDDLRVDDDERTAVFAAYLDVLYSSDLLTVVPSANRLGFQVEFGEFMSPDAATAFLDRVGIIDEFGTNDSRFSQPADVQSFDPRELATIFFRATSAGTAEVVGSPADFFPFRDTLLYGRDTAVPVDQIVYDRATLKVTSGGAESESRLQNSSFPQDVNADGFATPIDALIVINALGREGGEGEAAAAMGSAGFYTDVNGDGKVTALDALNVINHLTRGQTSGGEGEALVSATTKKSESTAELNVASTSGTGSVESEISLVGDGEATAETSGPVAPYEPYAETSSTDEDDDEMLDLLAADVSQIW